MSIYKFRFVSSVLKLLSSAVLKLSSVLKSPYFAVLSPSSVLKVLQFTEFSVLTVLKLSESACSREQIGAANTKARLPLLQ